MTSAFFCSECGYENVVAGCGFCLQCGAEFNLVEHQVPVEAVAQNSEAAQPAQIPAAVGAVGAAAVGAVAPAMVAEAAQALPVVEQAVAVPETPPAPDPSVPEIPPVAAASPEVLQQGGELSQPILEAARGGTIDFQTAIASAEQCDFEASEPSGAAPSSAVVEVQSEPVAEQAAAVPHIQVPQAEVVPQQPSEPTIQQPTRVPEPTAEQVANPSPQPADVAATLDEAVTAEEVPVEQDEFSEVLDESPSPAAPVAVAAAAAATVAAAQPIPAPEPPAPAETPESLEEDFESSEEESFAQCLEREMHSAIVSAAGLVNMRVREDGERLVAQLLIDGRPQLVFIEPSLNNYQTPVLSVFAVCGPVSVDNALPLLEWNRALSLCSFAVREIGEKKMFVIQSNVLAYAIDQSLLSKTLLEIAKRANQVNERLIG